MSAPSRRDHVWHAIFCTARQQETFGRDDVLDVAEQIDLDISERTTSRVLRSMVELGYLKREQRNVYRIHPEFGMQLSPDGGLAEVYLGP